MWPGGEGTENNRGRGWVGCSKVKEGEEKGRLLLIYFFFILFQNP